MNVSRFFPFSLFPFPFSLDKRSLDDKTGARLSPESQAESFNGKKLPKNIAIKKVEISQRSDGTRNLRFLDGESGFPLKKTNHDTTLNQTYAKTMKSRDYAVFPRTNRHKLGD